MVSKSLGTFRGYCKPCMKNVKRWQRNPEWRPRCTQCGERLESRRMGRQLCRPCLVASYSTDIRPNGARRKIMQPCIRCGEPKDRFQGSRYCRNCRGWTADSKDKNRARELWQKYGITESQYDAMLAMRDGGCWICGSRPKKVRLAVEHDHGPSKRVRGLACHTCNKYRIGVNTVFTARRVLEHLESNFDGRLLKV